MDSSGGLEPRGVFTILAWIAGILLLGFLLTELVERDRYGETFIGVCILIAGFTIARAIRSTRR